MKITFIGNSHVAQLNIPKMPNDIYSIDAINSAGSSIKGLSNPNSKLQLSKRIDHHYNNLLLDL